MKRSDIEFHELANIFPLLSDKEFSDLGSDIAENGLMNPIVLYEGKILDGRNRYRACLHFGKTPKFTQYTGKDPLKYVISTNLHRRHLNESQRSMVAAKIANLKNGQHKPSSANLQSSGVSQSEAAEKLNVSPRSVANANKVIGHGAQELQDAVWQGEVSVSAGADLSDLSEEEQARVVSAGEDEVRRTVAEIRQKKASEGSRAHELATKALMKWRDKYLFLGFEDLEMIIQEVFQGDQNNASSQ